MTGLLAGSIRRIAADLRAGRCSATEVVRAAVDAHERYGDRLGAYKLWDGDRALAEAGEADQALARGEARPLTGIPISVKDLYGVDGLPTFAGTPRQLPPEWSEDAWLVARLRSAGAIIVGKTHTVEMAFGGVGLNPHWRTPWNPWDTGTHRVPGGSSSGAGVSLWEGSALIALGSDTGGSIRIPAAFTGCVGQRTSHGRWPTTGVVPLSPTFDTVGGLTRTVVDSIYFFGTVDPGAGHPLALFDELDGVRVEGIRIGVPTCAIARDCQSDIGGVLEASLEELRRAGAEVTEVDGGLLDEAYDLSLGGGTIAATECRAFMARELPEWIPLLHPIVGGRLSQAVPPSDPLYTEGIVEQRRLAALAPTLFEGVDVLALPANLITPPRLDELEPFDEVDRYIEVNRTILRPTYPVGVLGLTGISIPVGRDDAGMPVGLQLAAAAGRDVELLGAAWAVERTLGTARERLGTPPVLVG